MFNFGFNGATTEVTAADNTMASLLAQFKDIVDGVANFTAAVSGNDLIVTAAAGQALPANNSAIAQTSETAETAAVQVNTTSTVTVGSAASLVKGNTITINDGTTDYKLIYMDDQNETVDSELTRLKDKVNAVNDATVTVTKAGGLPTNITAGQAVTQDGTAVGTVLANAAAAATSFQINATALMQSGTGAGDLVISAIPGAFALTDAEYTVVNGYTATYDSATKSIAIAADDTIGFTATTGHDATIN